MISKERREMFSDLYRIAEYYEALPFQPGDIYGNGEWFLKAHKEQLVPFLEKYKGNRLAADLAMDIVSDANRVAAEMNKQ